MAYNKAKEEKKWKKWKAKEERQMRELGVSEEVIASLRTMDWADFNEERRYRERQVDFPDYKLLPFSELEEPELNNIQRLLDAIEDDSLLHIMLEADKKTLQILLLRIIGYSVQEISEKLTAPEQTIYTRIRLLREKIKKIQESE